jgi:hypothetical protein
MRGDRDSMRTCRGIGHSWEPYDARRKPRVGWLSVLRCDRCGTLRHDLLDGNGFLLGRYYEHPDGYRYVALDETRADLRAWLVKRTAAARKAEPVDLDAPPLRIVSGGNGG